MAGSDLPDRRAAEPRRRGESTLALIDGHSLVYRAFFALPPLSTADGLPTNAVFGFARMLARLLEDEAPDHAVVTFDRGERTFRHEAYADYKAHRPSMPPELAVQIPLVKELVRGYGLSIVEAEGYEADDVIGTLARRGEADGFAVLIVTGDRDALQLVSPRVRALITKKGITEMERFDPDRVRSELGVAPDQIVDWKALTGDKSDNIPGVAGIGEKTAQRLLAAYGTLEAILARADEIGGRIGRALREQAETARLSRRLATIDCAVPLELDWADCRVDEPDPKRLSDLFSRLEFRQLLRELAERFPECADPAASAVGGVRSEALSLSIAHTPAELEAWLASVKAGDGLGVYLLADGEDAMRARLLGAGLAQGERVVYAPFGERPEAWAEVLGRALERGSLCTHDAKRQIVLLERIGLSPPVPTSDVMIASYLLGAGQGNHTLEEVAVRHLNEDPALPGEDGAPDAAGGRQKSPAAEWSAEQQAGWCKAALSIILRAAPRLEERLRGDELETLYRDVELPLAPVLARMEQRGIALDAGMLREMSADMAAEIERLTRRIHELAGEPFNINSPKQLGRILFEKLGLPVLQKTKSGPSTSAEVLEALAEQHEIAAALLDYRHLVKLKSTYVDVLPDLVHPKTGRVHTTYNQAIAATGRLSSVNPNLQNIPVRTADGQRIRAAFIPGEPGWKILTADYSQIELRVLAHIAEDENLIEAFRNGEDIHSKTAAEIFAPGAETVTPAMRSAAKAVNFGIVYGISSFGLARGTGLSQSEAQRYIDAYFERYPGVKRYMEQIVAEAREVGFVRTLFGRRRYLPELRSRNWAQRSFAERTAINTPIQGTAADIIKAAMVAVDRALMARGSPCRMLLQVHDELVFEVPADLVDESAAIIKAAMEGVVTLSVPLVVEMAAGPNWLETTAVAGV
ncbi:MAG TPA: DNA polymerase I [Limnochordia bacterium]